MTFLCDSYIGFGRPFRYLHAVFRGNIANRAAGLAPKIILCSATTPHFPLSKPPNHSLADFQPPPFVPIRSQMFPNHFRMHSQSLPNGYLNAFAIKHTLFFREIAQSEAAFLRRKSRRKGRVHISPFGRCQSRCPRLARGSFTLAATHDGQTASRRRLPAAAPPPAAIV